MNHASFSRRNMLRRMGAGMGTLGLASVMADTQLASAASPMAPVAPHFAPKAKHIIQLFQAGGPSHVDTFDYKPDLIKYAGQRPKEVQLKTLRNTKGNLMKSPYSFRQYGQCGKWVSEIFPYTAGHVDDICFFHSLYTDIPEHAGGILMMNLGHLQPIRPSMGAWLVYGLGTENQNLPGFVAMSPRSQPRGKLANWQNSFLPGVCAGSYVNLGSMKPETLMRDLKNSQLSLSAQREQAELMDKLNLMHLQRHQHDAKLEASIQSMELAFRMQMSVPEAFDLSKESKATRDLYGPGDYAKGCILARRLVERGVRMVQLSLSIDGYDIPWDTGHGNIVDGHRKLAVASDQAIAGLLKDLKQRGLLDETLVIWGGEFGRAPTSEGTKGRDHNHYGFTMWMAGGGVKGGYTHGATDNFGLRAVENRMHVHDFHATILHLMGINHEKLTYRHSGRDYRLTDVAGNVAKDVMA